MSVRKLEDHEGKFKGWEPSTRKCPKCEGPVKRRVWDSNCGGYEDDQFRCQTEGCGHSWWVDGIDS